jgi:hypothetical protein
MAAQVRLFKRIAIFVVFLFVFNSGSQAQVTDTRLMTDADYNAFLLQIEAGLPKWEAALKNIDPAKDERTSYSQGQLIVIWRTLGQKEIGNIRQYVSKQRVKRTVSGELALKGFLEDLFNTMDAIVGFEAVAGLNLSTLEKFAPELGALQIRIGNDVLARVELLEKGICP